MKQTGPCRVQSVDHFTKVSTCVLTFPASSLQLRPCESFIVGWLWALPQGTVAIVCVPASVRACVCPLRALSGFSGRFNQISAESATTIWSTRLIFQLFLFHLEGTGCKTSLSLLLCYFISAPHLPIFIFLSLLSSFAIALPLCLFCACLSEFCGSAVNSWISSR